MNGQEMNEKDELEKIFLDAKNDANKFFSNFTHENMNKAVFLKLKKDRKTILPGINFNYRLIAEISALSICSVFLIALLFFFGVEISPKNEEPASMGKPVSQQMIKLGNADLYQWLHFFMINKPDQVDDNLLAVIWKSGGGGDYEMAYSSLFENSNKPRPVVMIAFPDNQPSMAVISSQDSNKKYIHYRVLGYKDNKILAYIEQNYVVGGEIEVIDGALKETRLVPNNFVEMGNGGDFSRIVTYYILYQSDKFGDIIPSAESLKINKGDHIAIVGDGSAPIEAFDSKLLSDWEMGSELIDANKNVKLLYAKNSGHEDLYIKPLKGGVSKKISVEIAESGEAVKEH